MAETDKGRTVKTRLVLIGEAKRVPEIGEKLQLHVADGTWQHGFRCISGPLTEDGEQRVWVATEEEYRQAQCERRTPAGDTWPILETAMADHQ
jgi:hypothetical protein